MRLPTGVFRWFSGEIRWWITPSYLFISHYALLFASLHLLFHRSCGHCPCHHPLQAAVVHLVTSHHKKIGFPCPGTRHASIRSTITPLEHHRCCILALLPCYIARKEEKKDKEVFSHNFSLIIRIRIDMENSSVLLFYL